uniref:Uncharacterized protein n=1 Tax=Heterorhabditis bacteriophora TaxID=37862 RepID=A0A1I7WW33_HETBA
MFLRRFNNNISHINHILRYSSTAVNNPDFLKIQSQKPPNESGFIYYIRNFSRDPKYRNYSHFQKGNTPLSVYFCHLFTSVLFCHIFILVFFVIFLLQFFLKVFYIGKSSAPWDWERARNNYWKQTTVAFCMMVGNIYYCLKLVMMVRRNGLVWHEAMININDLMTVYTSQGVGCFYSGVMISSLASAKDLPRNCEDKILYRSIF